MPTEQGADERRVRQLLRTRGVGPDALAPQPAPATPAGDWWERLYDDTQGDHAGAVPKRRRIPPLRIPNQRKAALEHEVEPEPEADEDSDPEWEDADPDDESTPQAVRRSKNHPARRVQAAYAGLEPRIRALIYNGAAAGAGWTLGLEPLVKGWIVHCGHDTGHVSAALILGAGIAIAAAVLIDRRSRSWWPPLAWACRIPLASTILALALYAPGVSP